MSWPFMAGPCDAELEDISRLMRGVADPPPGIMRDWARAPSDWILVEDAARLAIRRGRAAGQAENDRACAVSKRTHVVRSSQFTTREAFPRR